MQVTFWGTRGSIPAPGFGTARFGGNTACVQVATAAGTQVILDCGTGARELGNHLLAEHPGGFNGHILLSHTHWDHIQGFPFFAPVFHRGFNITVHAPAGGERSLSEALAGQMQYTYFPVNLEQLDAKLECVDLQEGDFSVEEVRVRTHYVNHPGLTLGYRLECGGVSLVYTTDHEPFGPRLYPHHVSVGPIEQMLHEGDRSHAYFVSGADLLIHDAQYTAEEYEQKRNWGHSPLEYTVALAVAAGVKKLALFHHDPSHDDIFLARMESDAAVLAQGWGSTMEIIMAREGQSLHLRELDRLQRSTRPLRTPYAAPQAGARVLIIGDDKPVRDVLLDALRHDGHTLVMAHNGREGLDLAVSIGPDIILLDLETAEPSGLDVLRALRGAADPRLRDVTVLMLTASDDEDQLSSGFAAGANDYLHKPVTPAQLRTRVRTWLERLIVNRQD
ncbi:MAG TPA: response regulator [Chloroflexia bacterium]|nr:response regulator [Chloroflexia bacterium]